MQVLIRTMLRAAAQGDTKAGRQLLEVIARAESGRTGAVLENLEHAVQYKKSTVRFSNNASARALSLVSLARLKSTAPLMITSGFAGRPAVTSFSICLHSTIATALCWTH
jgi:N-acetylmuramic acid 6-phosphate (MurNAc-6-P) etherase